MAVETKNKITLSSSFIDESFDAKNGSGNCLLLQLSVDVISCAVKDVKKNKFIALESFTLNQVFVLDELTQLIDELLKESKLLPNKYATVYCVVANGASTLVPTPLYDDSKKATYLKFNTPTQEQDAVLTDAIKNTDAKVLFTFPVALKSRLDQLYTTIKYHHFSTILIDNVLAQTKNLASKRLFVHVFPSSFQLVLTEGKNLIFYNTFNYRSIEDFMYYLLFVCEQLQLNPETIELFLMGEIEKNSVYYSTAYKYIRNIKFAERPVDADYSYQLQTLPAHFYFNLFSTYAQQ